MATLWTDITDGDARRTDDEGVGSDFVLERVARLYSRAEAS
jgi:hypothetical protein